MNKVFKNVCITGAGNGIGQAIAVGLAQAGACVICAGRRACDETAAMIRDVGGTASSVLVDFTDPMAGQGLFMGQSIDILVNNAGIQTWSPLLDLKVSDWDNVIRTNLRGCFLNTQIAARLMVADGVKGTIIVMTIPFYRLKFFFKIFFCFHNNI